MGYIFNISCKNCDFVQERFQPYAILEAYEFADGSAAGVPNRTAWCRDCGKVVRAEAVPDPRELKSHLKEWEQMSASVSEPLRSDRLAEFQRLCIWREGRQSPPRCLECGGTDLVFGGKRGLQLTHPGCGGKLKFKLAGHVQFRFPPHLRRLSTEGKALESVEHDND